MASVEFESDTYDDVTVDGHLRVRHCATIDQDAEADDHGGGGSGGGDGGGGGGARRWWRQQRTRPTPRTAESPAPIDAVPEPVGYGVQCVAFVL